MDVPLWSTFSYLADRSLPRGQRVRVSFGSRRMCGVVTNNGNAEQQYAFRIKCVDEVFDELPPLPEAFLDLVNFAAGYYHHPYGQTLFTALPTALREPRAVRLPDRRVWRLTPAGRDAEVAPRHKVRHALWQALCADDLAPEGARAVAPSAATILKAWQDSGWVTRVDAAVPPLAVEGVIPLNTAQRAALDAIEASSAPHKPWLLHGVTGSGKTEVYLQLIERQLRAGRQVLVLVPEINLTPQLIARFTQRFPLTPTAVLHSHVADGERLVAWVDAWQGRARIVIGTRLAVFTPMPELGMVIVDEEHDGSFKQQDGLRYHARDLAVWRAHRAAVPIVLGSATPCLETLANVDAGRYRRLVLAERAHHAAALPTVRLVDVRRAKRSEGLTDEVLAALADRVRKRELSLVYINRRGFAPVVACTECGWLSGCPRCSAKLVVHLLERKLRCHHCGWEEAVPHVCPDCGNTDIKPLGEGTQRLEAALGRALPTARILRIDRDTTQRREAWNDIYRQVHAGEVDILVGTQMLAKGHDFGALSLVAILNADAALYSADFRASERLFSQLIQVAGRAGRAERPGEVLLQTQWPEHPLYQALVAHDFDRYAAELLGERRQLGFPPASFQAQLRADAPTLAEASDFLHTIRERLAQPAQASGVAVCGPAPALMVKLANRERAQLVLESPQRAALHQLLNQLTEWLPAQNVGRGLRWSLDVDPQDT
ncbi:replication restart DNA helicase PriA [Paludibacterium purpuratum]|uniref:Replication restart protein PriA n=1 Tax=Paludibacterium purpuratum TaxID=1144873 RepID=A0A4R7B186_9NEIS|nr:replication restart DNA helicase PriA [Paludibacterium purpuratum]